MNTKIMQALVVLGMMATAATPVSANEALDGVDMLRSAAVRHEIPLKTARMEMVTDDSHDVAHPSRLTLYGQFVGRSMIVKPTVFILEQDTGVRCITTPCPSTESTVYDITNSWDDRGGIKRYVAVERSLTDVTDDRVGAPRTLEVIDYSGAGHVRVRFMWFARITDGNGHELKMGGNPQSIRLTAGDGNR